MSLDTSLRSAQRSAGVDPAAGASVAAARLRAGATVAEVADEAARADPALRAAMIAELIRRGARDPRVDPRPWAWVESVGRYNGRHCSRVRREVVQTWPRVLASAYLIVTPTYTGRTIDPDSLPRVEPGWQVLQLEVFRWRGAVYGERAPDSWRMWARARPGDEWLDLTVHDAREPELCDDPTLEVLAVEWEHRGSSPGRRPQRSTIAQWRRWARGGTVLHLDCETRGLA